MGAVAPGHGFLASGYSYGTSTPRPIFAIHTGVFIKRRVLRVLTLTLSDIATPLLQANPAF